jgi:hypothetical protein
MFLMIFIPQCHICSQKHDAFPGGVDGSLESKVVANLTNCMLLRWPDHSRVREKGGGGG